MTHKNSKHLAISSNTGQESSRYALSLL